MPAFGVPPCPACNCPCSIDCRLKETAVEPDSCLQCRAGVGLNGSNVQPEHKRCGATAQPVPAVPKRNGAACNRRVCVCARPDGDGQLVGQEVVQIRRHDNPCVCRRRQQQRRGWHGDRRPGKGVPALAVRPLLDAACARALKFPAKPSDAMTSSGERPSAHAESSRLLHREVTDGRGFVPSFQGF